MKKLLLSLALAALAVAALGYSAWQSGLLAGFLPADDGLPKVDFKELHSRIKDPADLAYVTSIENAVLAEYDRLNPRSSAWYQKGRTAAQLFAFVVAQGDTYGEGLLPMAELFANAAWRETCRDPLILAVCDVSNFQHRYSASMTSAARHLANLEAMFASGYPAICKFEAAAAGMHNLVSIALDTKPREDLSSIVARTPVFFERSMESFAALVKSAPPAKILYGKTTMFFDSIDKSAPMLTDTGAAIDSLLAKADVPGALRVYARADCLINLAWAARGTGWADSVTREGWRIMRERLSEARNVLTAGAITYPQEKRLPTLMLTVELGQGGDIPAMDAWFHKAIALDPGYFRAYSKKMYFLQPKWHGTPRDVVNFGRECLATGRWDDCIPMVLVNGLDDLADQYKNLYQDAEIWKLYRSTCEEFLRRYPKSVCFRTKLFDAAVQAGQWKTAREQLKLLGTNWDRSVLDEEDFQKRVAAIPADA